MSEETDANNRLNVFISYSREDLDFSDQLDAALGLTGFDTTIDRHGISAGEEWKDRLNVLIRGADTVVFVLSPSSARSEICVWEVEEAIRLGKRIIPVVCRPLEDTVPPTQLSDLNYIFFYDEPRAPGSGFGSGLVKLKAALSIDLDWLRTHTRYLQRASEWDQGGRPTIRLLSGADIASAKAWITSRSKDAPEPTVLHLDFIRESEAEDIRTQNAEALRLRQLAEAQREREAAFAEKTAAQEGEAEQTQRVVRRTRIGMLVAVVLAAVAGWFGFKTQLALDDLEAEQRERTAQAFKVGWRALAGLDERSADETYEECGSIEGMKGVRLVYCEIANVLSLQTLATLSGLDVFERGPHTDTQDQQGTVYQYNLRSHEIGRYNPAFISWLGDFAVPAVNNELFKKSTKQLFDRQAKDIALGYYYAYKKLFDPAMQEKRVFLTNKFENDLSSYTAEMEFARRNIDFSAETNYLEIWGTSPSYKLQNSLEEFDNENTTSAISGESDEYELTVAMSFWVRRILDGTHSEFFDILVKALEAYDALPETELSPT